MDPLCFYLLYINNLGISQIGRRGTSISPLPPLVQQLTAEIQALLSPSPTFPFLLYFATLRLQSIAISCQSNQQVTPMFPSPLPISPLLAYSSSNLAEPQCDQMLNQPHPLSIAESIWHANLGDQALSLLPFSFTSCHPCMALLHRCLQAPPPSRPSNPLQPVKPPNLCSPSFLSFSPSPPLFLFRTIAYLAHLILSSTQ